MPGPKIMPNICVSSVICRGFKKIYINADVNSYLKNSFNVGRMKVLESVVIF